MLARQSGYYLHTYAYVFPCDRGLLKSGELYVGNVNGPSIDPWGRPGLSGLGADTIPWITTEWQRLEKYELRPAEACHCTPFISSILLRRISWLTMSNAALKSNMVRSTQLSSSIAHRKSLVIFKSVVSVLWHELNTDWHGSWRRLLSMCTFNCCTATFSIRLNIYGRLLTGL